MLFVKRLTIWFGEISCESFLVGLLLLALSYDPKDRFSTVSTRDIVALSAIIAFGFLITGYLFTSAVARAFWKGHSLWSYSLAAATLFFIHFEILSLGIGGAFAPQQRQTFQIIGPGLTFLCTYVGSYILRRWTKAKHPIPTSSSLLS